MCWDFDSLVRYFFHFGNYLPLYSILISSHDVTTSIDTNIFIVDMWNKYTS